MGRARQAASVAPDLVDDPNVRRTHRRSCGDECEVPSIATPGWTAYALRRHRDDRPDSRRELHHLELVASSHVPDERGALAIVGVGDLLELRVVSLREYLDPAGAVDPDPRECIPLAVHIRSAEHPAVAKVPIPELGLPGVRCEANLHRRAPIDKIDVAVTALDNAEEQDRVRVLVVDPRDPARARDGLAPRPAFEVDREGIPVRR